MALALAALASGIALLLAGAFAPRLTKIKLPGVEVETEPPSSFGEAGYLVMNAAKKEEKEDVLVDPEKFADAVKLTVLLASFSEDTMITMTAPIEREQLLLKDLTTIDEDKAQKAAEAAVTAVSDET